MFEHPHCVILHMKSAIDIYSILPSVHGLAEGLAN